MFGFANNSSLREREGALVSNKTAVRLATPTEWRHTMTSFDGAFEDGVDALVDVARVDVIDERRRDEEGDHGADVENEKHSVKSQSD